MKPFFLLTCFALALAASGFSAEEPAENPSAYAAMRLVGKQLGGDSLSRIVEIIGHDGVPQPFIWKVVVKGKESVQEVDVAGGKIAGQRTVDHSPSSALPAIHLQDLNLDSSGAFEAADTQARKVHLRFEAVGYQLRIGENGKPVWTLDLVNGEGARVGGMRLAASDGAALSMDGRLAVNDVPNGTGGPIAAADGSAPVVDPGDESGGFFTRAGRTLDHTNETVKRNLRKASSRVQRFFGLHGEEETPEPQN